MNKKQNTINKNHLALSGIFLIILITAGLITASWFYLKKLNIQLQDSAEQSQIKEELITTMWDIARERESALQKMLFVDDSFTLDDIFMAHLQLGEKFLLAKNTLYSMNLSEKENKYLSTLDKAMNIGSPIQNRIKNLVIDNKREAAILLSHSLDYLSAREEIFKQFNNIVSAFQKYSKNSLENANNIFLNRVSYILLFTAAILFFSVIALFYMLKKISLTEDQLKKEISLRIISEKNLKRHQGTLEKNIEEAIKKHIATEESRNKSMKIAATFGHILETSLNEIYIFDAQTLALIQVNAGARKNLGYSKDEISKMTALSLTSDSSEKKLRKRLSPLLNKSKKTIIYSDTYLRKDGTSYPAEIHCQKSIIDDKIVFVSMVIDITKRLEWQEQLNKKTNETEIVKNKLAFQKIALEEHSIVIIIDNKENVINVNRKCLQTSSYDETELIGENFFDYIIEDKQQLKTEINDVLNTIRRGDIWNGTLCVKGKNNSIFWMQSTITPFFNKDAEIYQYAIVSTDISEHLQLQKTLKLRNKEIEKAHEELNASHLITLHSEKLASVGQLAAGIAHEINTPIQFVGDNTRFLQESFEDLINLVNTYEELAKSVRDNDVEKSLANKALSLSDEIEVDYLAEEVPNAITQTLDGVDRVSTIVRSMKDFSHPGSDSLENIDLNHSIKSTINVSRNEWKYCAQMHTYFDPELTTVSCFPGELNQVILNMIVNAAHAIEAIRSDSDPLGSITIKTRSHDDNVEIQISDTGNGMPDDIKKHIFEPFFTTKGVGKGTGQGLAIAYSVIVDKHKGKINVDSEPGKGTTFTMLLPKEITVNDTINTQDTVTIKQSGVM